MKRWLTRKVHVSWFVAWASAGVLVGGAASLLVRADVYGNVTWLIFAILLLLCLMIRRLRFMLMLGFMAGLLIGLWRGSVERLALTSYEPYYGQKVKLIGKIVEDTSYGPKGDQRLRLGAVQINHQPLHDEIWISTGYKDTIKRGDMVTVEGTLGKGFGNLPASMFHASITSVERPHPGDIARQVRDWFGSAVQRAIPSPQSSLGIGYLDGQRSALPDTLDNQLRMIGLTHVVVASGYNLTILVRLSRRLLAKTSKYLAAITAGSMIVSFMLISGLSPSMSRAGLVSGLSLLAWYYGRTIHPLVLLPFAAAITVLIRPSYLWGDIGWYLSFSAFAGVIVLAPLLQRYFWASEKSPHFISQILIETTSAQIATLPIILLVFGQYSIYALPANLLILPLVPLAMLLTFIAGLGALIMPSFAYVFGFPAYALLHYMTTMVDKIANLPGVQTKIHFTATLLAISYVGLVVISVMLWRKTRYNFRESSVVD
jgi:competence protein ComEC